VRSAQRVLVVIKRGVASQLSPRVEISG
jgi:hypothetical protein